MAAAEALLKLLLQAVTKEPEPQPANVTPIEFEPATPKKEKRPYRKRDPEMHLEKQKYSTEASCFSNLARKVAKAAATIEEVLESDTKVLESRHPFTALEYKKAREKLERAAKGFFGQPAMETVYVPPEETLPITQAHDEQTQPLEVSDVQLPEAEVCAPKVLEKRTYSEAFQDLEEKEAVVDEDHPEPKHINPPSIQEEKGFIGDSPIVTTKDDVDTAKGEATKPAEKPALSPLRKHWMK